MDNKVKILNQKIAVIFNDLRNVERNMIRTNLALAHLAGPYRAILNQAISNLREYLSEITRISDGIATMSRGFLTPDLILPWILESVLNETDQALQNERFTTLELIKIPLTEHYKRRNVIFAITDTHIIVQLELLLTHHKSQVYRLFRMETIPIPFDTSSGTNKPQPHIQLVTHNPYLTINSEYYTS